MAIIDVCTFNGEYDIWDIRYNILKDYVDEFIMVEAPTTFSGNLKPLYFENIKDKYEKVTYFVIDENYTPQEIALAESSPNTSGASHWKHEFLQKESIKKALVYLKDDDVVFIGDVDEIYGKSPLELSKSMVCKLKLQVRPYFLNNLSNEEFWGTIMGTYSQIKNECLNHLRTNAHKTFPIYGYHFTSQGGLDEVRRKLNDSYTAESYNTAEVQQKLEERFKQNKDYIGRAFVFTKDESDLPRYLLNNKEKYAKLFLK